MPNLRYLNLKVTRYVAHATSKGRSSLPSNALQELV